MTDVSSSPCPSLTYHRTHSLNGASRAHTRTGLHSSFGTRLVARLRHEATTASRAERKTASSSAATRNLRRQRTDASSSHTHTRHQHPYPPPTYPHTHKHACHSHLVRVPRFSSLRCRVAAGVTKHPTMEAVGQVPCMRVKPGKGRGWGELRGGDGTGRGGVRVGYAPQRRCSHPHATHVRAACGKVLFAWHQRMRSLVPDGDRWLSS